MENNYKIAGAIVLIAIVAVALIFVLPSGISGMFGLGAETQEGKIIHVGYLPLITGAPLFLALDNNYFELAGLKIEATPFDAPNTLVDALMQGRIDIGITNTPAGIIAVAEAANPGKIKIYSLALSTKDNPNESLVVAIDSNINSFAELKGKKLGILGASIQWKAIAQEILTKEGLVANKDVEIVELAPTVQAQALATGQVDALIAVEPIRTTLIVKGFGKEIMAAPVANYISTPFSPVAGAINVEFAKNNPITAKTLLEVIDKAANETNKSQIEIRESIRKYLTISDDVLYNANIPKYKTCTTITEEDIKALQEFYDIFAEQKLIKNRISARQLFYCN